VPGGNPARRVSARSAPRDPQSGATSRRRRGRAAGARGPRRSRDAPSTPCRGPRQCGPRRSWRREAGRAPSPSSLDPRRPHAEHAGATGSRRSALDQRVPGAVGQGSLGSLHWRLVGRTSISISSPARILAQFGLEQRNDALAFASGASASRSRSSIGPFPAAVPKPACLSLRSRQGHTPSDSRLLIRRGIEEVWPMALALSRQLRPFGPRRSQAAIAERRTRSRTERDRIPVPAFRCTTTESRPSRTPTSRTEGPRRPDDRAGSDRPRRGIGVRRNSTHGGDGARPAVGGATCRRCCP
jgi:hypothetical protein